MHETSPNEITIGFRTTASGIFGMSVSPEMTRFHWHLREPGHMVLTGFGGK